jgi:uncharacterized repeat protein (TIGR01451 family)
MEEGITMIDRSHQRTRHLTHSNSWLRIVLLSVFLLGGQLLLLAPKDSSAQAAATPSMLNAAQHSMQTKLRPTTIQTPAFSNAPGVDATISNTAPNASYTVGDSVVYSIIVSTTAFSTPIVSGATIDVTDSLPLGLTNITVDGGKPWTVSASTPISPSAITASYVGAYPVAPATALPAITITGTLAATAGATYASTATIAVLGDTNNTNDTSTYTFNVVTPSPTPSPTLTPTPTPSPTPGITPTPTLPNLALDGQATTSSVLLGSAAANAVDGNATTSWSSAVGSGPLQWVQVDLGNIEAIDEVTLLWGTPFASAYQIQTSNDDISWTTIYSTTTGAGGTEDLTGLTGFGRYLRMYATTFAGPNITLNELEAFGPAVAKPNLYTVISHTGGNIFSVGQTINYTITTTNLTGSTPESQTLTTTDVLPSGLTNIVTSGSNWQITSTSSISPAVITAVYTGVYPIAAATALPPLFVSGTLTTNAIPSFTNQATTTSIDDTNIALDTISVLPAITSSDLTITQMNLGHDPFKVGQRVTYVLTVSNASAFQSADNPISVTEALPTGLKDIQAHGIGWSIYSNTGSIYSKTNRSPTLITANYISSFPLTAGSYLPSIIISGTLTNDAVPAYLSTATVYTLNDINTSNNRVVNFIDVEKGHSHNQHDNNDHQKKHGGH